MSKLETNGKLDSQMLPGDLNTLGQGAGAIFSAQENLLRDANVACRFRGARSTGFPSALTIDASVFTDQLKPTVRPGHERRETLKASILVEERREDIAGEQQVEDRREDSKNDKKTPRAAGNVCVSETCGEKKIKRQTSTDASANEELLARIEEINPTKLSEMINKEINNSIKEINNSIKDAVQTIVKQCSMEEKKSCSTESERKSRACQFRVADKHCKKSPTLSCRDRRTICPAMRQYNNSTRDSSFSRAKTRKDTIPLPVNINEKRNKKHSKPASNMSTDNRRMTGNVNIYICSEANDNSADKSKRKTKTQSCTETSTDTITEQSNSRCASSASTCKLINCIQEKRRKLQAQRLSNTLHKRRDKSSDSSENNVVCDTNNTTVHSICRKVSSETSKKGVDVKLSDEDVECGDTISSTRDGCCCEDTNSTTGPRCDSSESVIPCTRSFSIFDNSIRPQSWTTIYPSKAEAESNRSDITLNYDGNDARNKICGNDGEYSVCGAIDGNRWQRKSIYTDCATYGEKVPKECFADNCRYRNKKVQDSAVNGNDIWRKRVGYKLWQPTEDCRREHVTLQRSACSCIAEEEEDRCASVDRVENELPESVCEEATCPEKISVCRAPSRELAGDATVCGTSFSAVGKCSEETRTCKSASKDPAECRNGATVCVTTFKNSKEPPKVTRVCKELVAEESSEDIAVCRTVMFGEPKGPPEGVAVSKAFPDSEGAPKETICKKIPDSNFADRDDVKTVFLNSAEDKLAEGNTNSSNLNNWLENVGNTVRIKKLDKFGNRDNFAGRKSTGNIKQGEQKKKLISNDETNIPVRSIKDTTSRSIYSTIPRNSINLISNPKASKHVSNTRSDQQGLLKFQPPNRPLRNYSRQPSRIAKRSTMRDLAASRKNNQTEKKAQDKSKEDKEKHNIPREVKRAKEEQPREPLLYRSMKKLANILKYTREQLKAKREAEKTKFKEKIVGDKRDVGEFKTISETEDKIIDEKGQKLIEQIEAPLADGEISEKTEKPESIADFPVSKEDKKTDVLKINETTRLKPKLIRIIATKRLRVPTIAATDFKPPEPEIESVRVVTDSQPQESEVESPAVETITSDRLDQEETFQEETIIQEPILEEIQEEPKVEPKISIAEIKVPTKDIADEEEVLKGVIDKKTQVYALFLDEKQRDLQKLTSCKCDVFPDSNGSYLIAKRAKLYVPCPQKKTEDETKKTIPCTSPPSFDPKGCSCLSYKSTQCHKISKECFCKDDERIDHRAPPQYLKSCLKTSQKFDKPKFRDISPLKISPHICSNCYKTKEECVCRKTSFSCQLCEECKCRWCATRADYSRTVNKRRLRDQCNCIFTEYNKITKVCNCRKAMICLYCDNPRDKCTCRAPIGKCSSCGLPSDVCNCQVDEDTDRDCKQINERSDKNRTIQVTSWKPRKEIRRYFTRNPEDFQSNPTEECRCCEKPNRQHIPEEQLPYQRLNIFSDVMNELQQKISESICCSRCWRNPCCCELRASQNKERKEKKSKDHVRYLEMEKSPRNKLKNKSPNNCRCNSSPKTKRKNNVEESISIRRTNCVCEVSPCRCRRNRPNNKRPLAKCYYCKSLPCA